MPKSLDVGKAIDKARRRDYVAAAVRLGMEIPGRNLDDWTKEDHSPGDRWWEEFRAHLPAEDWYRLEREVTGFGKSGVASIAYAREVAGEYGITAPATEDAARWSGWGTAIKPAHEPIILARKPLSEGTVAANVLRWGTGALNVDGCKVAHANGADLAESQGKNPGRDGTVTSGVYGADRPQQSVNSEGRWPPNLLLTHSADCRATSEVVMVKPNGGRGARPQPEQLDKAVYGHGLNQQPGAGSPDPEPAMVWDCAPGCPVAGLDAQSGVRKSAYPGRPDQARAYAGTNCSDGDQSAYQAGLGPAGLSYADSGGASRFFPAFTWSPEYDLPFMYQAKAPKKERPRIVTDDGRVIQHPTVKPIALMRWLVRLVTPPGGTVGDFFTGTGPVVQAALDEGMRCVASDQDPDSVALSRVRLAPYAGVRFTVPEPAAQSAEQPDAEVAS